MAPLVSLTTLGGHADAILGIIGVLALLIAVWKWSVRMSKKFDQFNALVDHELNHNSGSSIKDKTYEAVRLSQEALDEAKRAAAASEKTATSVDSLTQTLQAYVLASATEHANIWKALNATTSSPVPIPADCPDTHRDVA